MCTRCPAGEECPLTNTTGTACAAGTYSVGGQTESTPCPAGYYCPDVKLVPLPCPIGQYSNKSQDSCTACEPGFQCQEGSSSNRPTLGLCPQGYFCTDGRTATPCPAGKYGSIRGAVSEAEGCAQCPQGYYCLEATVGVPRSDRLCPRGHYCPAGTSALKEHPCPGGTNYPDLGAVTDTECLSCPQGRICAAGTYDPMCTACICPRGHYCPLNSSIATPCPAGTYTEEEGAVGQQYCKACPAGHWCASGTHTPTPCIPGTYNPMISGQNVTSCSPCISGMSCTDHGLTAPNYPCAPGYYCPGGNYRPNQTEYACPAGTFTNFNNLTSVDQCETCPERVACLVGTGGLQKPPVACAKGHFCERGTPTPTMHPCPAGTWTNLTNLASVGECYVCPRGWYCVQASTAPTDLCHKGHWCPEGKY